MNLIALTIGVGLFISGIILGRQSLSSSSTVKKITDNFSGMTSPTQTVVPTTLPTPQPIVETSVTPTIKSNLITTPTPKGDLNGDVLTRFTYPNAKVSKKTETEVELEIQADPQTISAWYTDTYKKEQYKSLSHAKTNTNGTIVEKFSGSKNNQQINVTINKKAQENLVFITLTTKIVNNGEETRIEINEKSEGYL